MIVNRKLTGTFNKNGSVSSNKTTKKTTTTRKRTTTTTRRTTTTTTIIRTTRTSGTTAKTNINTYNPGTNNNNNNNNNINNNNGNTNPNTNTNTNTGIGNITVQVKPNANNSTVTNNVGNVNENQNGHANTNPIDNESTTTTPPPDSQEETNVPNTETDGNGGDGSYTVGILSAALTVSGAAGFALLYLKKSRPAKYDELKSKFPEAFTTIKRGLSRSLTRSKSKNINNRYLNRHENQQASSVETGERIPSYIYSPNNPQHFTLYDTPNRDFP